jgi:hypothetical protein
MPPGTITLIFQEAILDRDTSTFLDMNPKYVINWREERIEGEPAYGGGKNPRWLAEHNFDIGNHPEEAGVISITIMDDDNLIC